MTKGASCFVLRASLSLGTAVLACAYAPTRLCAQSDPRLIAAVRLAQEGQGDSARIIVKRIIDATPAANPLYAEALYAAGRVAATNVERERQFQRLVVEFNGSAWSDDALLQLMQMNFARGDLPGVVRTAERLAGDYPQSEVIPQAAVWAARAYFREDSTTAGCRWVTNGLARADTLDVELRNGLVFLGGRCGVAADTTAGRSGGQAVRPESTVAAPTQPTPVPATPTAGPPDRPTAWVIQVAVASNRPNAEALITTLGREGFPGGRIFSEGGVFKVRLGRASPDRTAVDALLARVRVKHPQAFVVEERP
jgi:hypothetical protein